MNTSKTAKTTSRRRGEQKQVENAAPVDEPVIDPKINAEPLGNAENDDACESNSVDSFESSVYKACNEYANGLASVAASVVKTGYCESQKLQQLEKIGENCERAVGILGTLKYIRETDKPPNIESPTEKPE